VTDLAALARRHHIATAWHGIDGTPFHPPETTLRALLAAFGVPCDGGAERAAASPAPELRAPSGAVCHIPDWLADGRAWGVAVQLYQLRSGRNWGIGDFADLATLGRMLGEAGADFVGVNPLHAPFLANPGHCSPFSPSNRRFLNPLYIAVDRLDGFAPGLLAPGALDAARSGDLVDYPAVARLKLDALAAIWATGRTDRDGLERFRADGGVELERHAIFEALSARMVADGHGPGWLAWPEAFRDPDAPAVRTFAAEAEDAVAFHAWLQFLADRQLAEARDAALAAGMRIGLYLDFAVGEEPDGSSTWSDRTLVLPGIRVGAPPDYFSTSARTGPSRRSRPARMAATRAAPFRELMEDATRRAGALRIDHVMALWQLFLIPPGATPAEGTYVRFPIEDMLRALAAASQANQTVVIGEDLGNVPEGFRDVMAAAGVLSYRILFFERDHAGFIPPERYPARALTCLSTHDLPTFQGWWRGDDVDLRAAHGLFGPEAAEDQRRARDHERGDLLRALADAGVWTGTPGATAPDDLVVAVHRHLARAPSMLFAARLEDMAGEVAPVNLPGTVDVYPNWRRRLGVTLEDLADTPLFSGIAAALAAERPR
jgi:4-alpha-glucanotransferase